MRYVDNYWKHYYIAAITISVLAWFCAMFIPESPRWLKSKNFYDEAKASLETIARVNR